MSWLDTLTSGQRSRLILASREAVFPSRDDYIDWLIDRGEIYTRAQVDEINRRQAEELRRGREENERQLEQLDKSMPDEYRRMARVVRKVSLLYSVRRKTVRMDDLARALGIEGGES